MTYAHFGWYRLKGGHLAEWLYEIYRHPMTSVVGLTTGKHLCAAVITWVRVLKHECAFRTISANACKCFGSNLNMHLIMIMLAH